jgi:signal transduction histidine kinase
MNPVNFHLFLHNFFFSFDVLLVLFLIFFTLIKAKKNTATVTLVLMFASVIVFVVSHMLGVSVADGEVSRQILMFNLDDILIPIFTAHCVFALLGRQHEEKKAIVAFYVVGLSLIAFFVLNPRLFLLTSVPKMYFPSYYQPGPYYWVMLVFFFSTCAYFFFKMIRIYRVSSGIEKNRIIYFFTALLLGFSLGSIDFLLIYNIPVDPLWGFLFVPLFTIPFTYAAVQYELMNIKFIAKNAFVYGLITVAIGIVLSGLNYLNTFIIQDFPEFPVWGSSLVLALIAAAAALFIWRKSKESDVLKYEFVTIVTHKFRTPLTYIKWSAENLVKEVTPELVGDVKNIQAANSRLVELTNLLAHLSDADDTSTGYHSQPIDIEKVLEEIIAASRGSAQAKGIDISYAHTPVAPANIDEQRMRFVFQTLLDNAATYTPAGGKITVSLSQIGSRIIVNFSDTGIGISKDDLKYIFNKFYRTLPATKTDTEGMGLGLFLAREIVRRHNGSLVVKSDGEGKGTSFILTIPIGMPEQSTVQG